MTWLFTDPLSGAQELGFIIGSALVAYGFYRIGVTLLNSHARLVIVRKPTVVTFPPEPTAFVLDVDGDPRVTEYPPPPALTEAVRRGDLDAFRRSRPADEEATDALYDTERLISQKAGR
jgi:hypothetical protein